MNNNIEKGERVEVMALFNYSQIPCQPLYFRLNGEDEIEITETLSTRIKFAGKATKHIFDCLVGRKTYKLEFDTSSLAWTLYR